MYGSSKTNIFVWRTASDSFIIKDLLSMNDEPEIWPGSHLEHSGRKNLYGI